MQYYVDMGASISLGSNSKTNAAHIHNLIWYEDFYALSRYLRHG